MYINEVADSVMLQLYLQHDFYNIIFKIKPKLYIDTGSATVPPQGKLLGAYPVASEVPTFRGNLVSSFWVKMSNMN